MSFEINERVRLLSNVYDIAPGTVGTILEHRDGFYRVLVDGEDGVLVFYDHELESTGVVSNPPPHANSTTFFEPMPDAEVAANIEDAIGMKYDGDKARMDLLLDGAPGALEAVADILTFGAKKYADHSWQTVPNGKARYKAALLRHLTAHAKGELNDPESGMSHLAHAACNAMFILQLEINDGTSVQ